MSKAPAKPAVGVIGLGNMGGGIAANLARAGHPVLAWDSDGKAAARAAARRGVRIAEPAEMAAEARVIFYVVPASPQIAETLGGRKGVLASAAKGLTIYDLTTSDPAATRKLARKAARKGVAYLDAGMSGGAAGADKGTLTLMVGGDEAAFRRTRRFLKPFADKVIHLGGSGAGHTAKVIHNMVCHTVFLATCEGARLGEKAGLDLAALINVFNAGNARSYASESRFPRHILSGSWDGRSRVYNLGKDLGLAMKLAKSLKVNAKLGADTHAFLAEALRQGRADQDFTLLFKDFDKIGRRG